MACRPHIANRAQEKGEKETKNEKNREVKEEEEREASKVCYFAIDSGALILHSPLISFRSSFRCSGMKDKEEKIIPGWNRQPAPCFCRMVLFFLFFSGSIWLQKLVGGWASGECYPRSSFDFPPPPIFFFSSSSSFFPLQFISGKQDTHGVVTFNN